MEEVSHDRGEDRVVTIPNVLSLARLLCVPVFLVLLFRHPVHRVAAAYLLSVLGATDWMDGYAARHLHQVSNLGTVLDPVADRVLLGVHPYFTFIPSGLRCNACGLELDGTDEMDVAGIAEPWQLDDVDERDFFGDDEGW